MTDGSGGRAITARLASGISAVEPDAWDACAGTTNPFIRHAFLAALEWAENTVYSYTYFDQV